MDELDISQLTLSELAELRQRIDDRIAKLRSEAEAVVRDCLKLGFPPSKTKRAPRSDKGKPRASKEGVQS